MLLLLDKDVLEEFVYLCPRSMVSQPKGKPVRNEKEVCGEQHRFEKLMEYFRNEDSNIDFMVACMQFINIVVHSVENMNFRVFLQYEFTHLGLDLYLERLRLTESDKLQVQIQAYLDNVFDVGALLEDTETKNAVLEHVEELQEQVALLTERLRDAENESMAKIAELEKQLSQARKELETLRELDMSDFEEQFKTKSQGPNLDLSALKSKAAQKTPSKATLIEANRAKNLAITLRKGNLGADRICQAIETYDLQTLGLDFLELLTRFLPTEYEHSLIARFERDQRPIEELSEEDRFMLRFSRIPRLPERVNTLTFLGNFPDTVQLLMPQLNAIIAASMSIKSSDKLRQILEIVLAFGNYMNSSKRGAAYGFRLQSLDALLEMKSTDRKQTLLHYLVKVIAEKYPQLTGFHSDLHFLDKAGTVSLDSVLADVRSLQRGLELTQREFVRQDDCAVLKEFLRANSPIMDKLLADSKTAQEAYESVVEYFGENPKTTSPSMFFSLFSRFIKAYKKAEQEVEQWKKAAAAQEAGTDTPGKGEPPAPKSPPKIRRQQMDLISELKRKQQKEPLIYESDRDGAIEDIITDLRNQPYIRADTGRRSARLEVGEERRAGTGSPTIQVCLLQNLTHLLRAQLDTHMALGSFLLRMSMVPVGLELNSLKTSWNAEGGEEGRCARPPALALALRLSPP
ncbi:Formin-like protein 1, partial [Eschrichtius robustus]|nr:Formin-like protein 1 [Eschrichtius robustus]